MTHRKPDVGWHDKIRMASKTCSGRTYRSTRRASDIWRSLELSRTEATNRRPYTRRNTTGRMYKCPAISKHTRSSAVVLWMDGGWARRSGAKDRSKWGRGQIAGD